MYRIYINPRHCLYIDSSLFTYDKISSNYVSSSYIWLGAGMMIPLHESSPPTHEAEVLSQREERVQLGVWVRLDEDTLKPEVSSRMILVLYWASNSIKNVPIHTYGGDVVHVPVSTNKQSELDNSVISNKVSCKVLVLYSLCP